MMIIYNNDIKSKRHGKRYNWEKSNSENSKIEIEMKTIFKSSFITKTW